jgi:hypothetical protein
MTESNRSAKNRTKRAPKKAAARPGRRADRLLDAIACASCAISNRGDWTPVELFVSRVRDWDAALRRILAHAAG